jgi:hypothetical protein
MGNRCNIVTCSFEKESQRISSFDIHEWIYDDLQLPTEKVGRLKLIETNVKCTLNLQTVKRWTP